MTCEVIVKCPMLTHYIGWGEGGDLNYECAPLCGQLNFNYAKSPPFPPPSLASQPTQPYRWGITLIGALLPLSRPDYAKRQNLT